MPQPSYDDQVPILVSDGPYGPDPYQGPPEYDQEPYQDVPPVAPTPTPTPGGLRRWKTVKEVQLFNGNLVLDCPIPSKSYRMWMLRAAMSLPICHM